MDLIKKHYEKIVLLLLLLLFAGLLLYLLDIIRSTGDITEDDLKIPTPKADYQTADPDSRQFDFKKLFGTIERRKADGSAEELPLEWRATPPRDMMNKEFHTDLTIMYKAAHCVHCNRIIPVFYFSDKNCPVCGKLLLAAKNPSPPPTGGPGIQDPGLDSDNDGIPDVVETQYGLNPAVADSMGDLDGDGFPNLYEYEQGTAMNDPKSHPPLYYALRVAGFQRTKLPVILKNVYSNGSRCQLDTTVTINGTERVRSQFLANGEKVQLDGKEYNVTEIKPVFEERDDVTGVSRNVSTVRFVCGEDVIVMKIGEDVYAPHERVIFEYLFDSESRVLGAGEAFSLGNDRVGVDRFNVKSLDNAAGSAVISNENGKDFVIGGDFKVPEKYRSAKAAGQEVKPPAPASAPSPAAGGSSALALPSL